MSSALSTVTERARAPANVGLAVAVVLALLVAYATEFWFDLSTVSYFALVVVGVSTPTTFENHGLLPDRLPAVVRRVAVGCLASWALLLATFTLARDALAPTGAAVVSFLVTALVASLVARTVA